MSADWTDFSAAVLAESVARDIADMLASRDDKIEELERELALAEAELEKLRAVQLYGSSDAGLPSP